jgi:hypothetical protein
MVDTMRLGVVVVVLVALAGCKKKGGGQGRPEWVLSMDEKVAQDPRANSLMRCR